MSTGIYRVEMKDLTWGHEFAVWLSDKVSPSEGDLKYISTDDLEAALKKESKKFRYDYADQIKSMQKALDENGGSFDIWISW